MSATPTQAALPDDPGRHAAAADGYRDVLHDLITMGTGFARLLHGTATAQAAQHGANQHPAPNTLIPLAAAFDQIARAVRRSILLARSLDRPLPPTQDPAHIRTAARQRIIRDVEDRIGRATTPDNSDTSHNAADLHAELRDRLDAPDLDRDLATRPIPDIITEICRDLGIAAQPGANPWRRRTPADLAHLRARAAAPTPAQPGAEPQPNQNLSPRPPAHQPTPAPKPRAQPGPIHPPNPAAIIATIPRHPTRNEAPWRPPPGD